MTTELSAVLDALAAECATGRAAVLATVVAVAGSGYRRPGARMLVTESGRRVGSVSGGCLEDDICRRARWLTESGPAVATYDTADDGDGPYRLGCGGTVRVLVERVGPAEPPELRALRAALSRHEPAALATVFAADAAFPARLGARWVGAVSGIDEVDAELRAALGGGRSRSVALRIGGARGELLIEAIRQPTRLALFGAGPDVAPVVQFAKGLGWRVAVIDRRPAATLAGRFPDADATLSIDPATAELGTFDAAVVMTHSYPDDLNWLRLLLRSTARYVGVLGARHRTARLVADLGGAGGNLYGPVGLDLGAETPAEIALAVVAEIRAVLAGREGGHLRGRALPVHDPFPAAVISPHGPAPPASCGLAGRGS